MFLKRNKLRIKEKKKKYIYIYIPKIAYNIKLHSNLFKLRNCFIQKRKMATFFGSDSSWIQKDGIYVTSTIPNRSKQELIKILQLLYWRVNYHTWFKLIVTKLGRKQCVEHTV